MYLTACTAFEKEIDRMHNFQRTWIEGYSGGRLVSMKDHCSGNPHVKALRSYKASILNLPAQSGQKEIDINVSQDEMKRLKRKANIAYFAMKNDISFRKYPNLVDLVKKEGNLDVEKDIGTLYVNKEGCRQFINAHGEVTLLDVAETVSRSNFFSALMDGSTIHKREKEGVYIQAFQKDEFVKGGDPTITRLLNIPDIEEVSANADALKNSLDLHLHC